MPIIDSSTRRAALTSWISGYRDVFAAPRLRGVVVTSAIARLPKGMAPLSLVVLVRDTGHSYVLAGLVAALLGLGDAATTPWQGRLVDTYGRGRVLLPTAFLHVTAVSSLIPLANGGAPPGALAAVAFAAGAGMPPVSGCVKAAWPDLSQPGRSATVYAIESLVQQVVFLVGPLLVAIVISTAGPTAALACSAAFSGAGTALFVLALAKVTCPPRRRTAHRGALRVATVRVLVLCTMCQGMVFGAIPVVVTAVSTGLSGVLQATVTIGGLLGTAWPMATAGARRYVRLSACFTATLLPMLAAAAAPQAIRLLAFGVCLTVAGVFVTPVAVACYRLVETATGHGNGPRRSRGSPPDRRSARRQGPRSSEVSSRWAAH